MILISKQEREKLESVGLLQYKQNRGQETDQNFVVVNKSHKGRHKRYYVVETPEVLLFLGHYDNFNLQKIRPDQYKKLIKEKLIDKNMVQEWNTYCPNAVAFQDAFGQWRIKKIPALMIALGIWRQVGPKSAAFKTAALKALVAEAAESGKNSDNNN